MGQPVRKKSSIRTKANYSKIASINGNHPLRETGFGSYVDYQARKRKNGKVLYFNFELAKEMGLITKSHDNALNEDLDQTILDTFAIQIINEYDIINKTKISDEDKKENHYMATRYLQLQHPSKTGLTSGDGRSIWNGYVEHKGRIWDVSSCGTGATCLSPASAQNERFYKSGDPAISYGCGYSEVLDGFSNALLSEIFHRNGLKTERTLVVIQFPKGLSINVRVGENLLRPSHFFNHLKQGNYNRLKAVVDSFIERQIINKEFNKSSCQSNPYQYLLDYVSKTFARMCARFENDYIFCWLDWDGDNILCDGGIIDYGSIRQFGLFHHEYRYDDDERWSTNILEQKNKAKTIVKTFVQLCDFLQTKNKKPLVSFQNAKTLIKFEEVFENAGLEFLLNRLGFNQEQSLKLIKTDRKLIKHFRKTFSYFEKSTSKKGKIKMEDGVNVNAIFCMRDILRELPSHYIKEQTPLSSKKFIEVLRSKFATTQDLKITPYRKKKISQFQVEYLKILEKSAKLSGESFENILQFITERSSIINRFERVTGDAIIYIGEKIFKTSKKLNSKDFHFLIEEFIEDQVLDPDRRQRPINAINSLKGNERLYQNIVDIIKENREGL